MDDVAGHQHGQDASERPEVPRLEVPDSSAAEPRSPRPRGVRLSDLDRGRLYVIGYRRNRWETLGPLDELATDAPAQLRPQDGHRR